MNSTCQQRTFQADGGSVMAWSVCSWRDMGPLIRIDMTLTGRLQEHSTEFRHFRLPPKSTDMNITEHFSDALQRAVQKISPPPLNTTDLCTAALQDS
ncbi:transposable element Tcb2 transposase [Trichonephila clavipes]|nr:transposable element Tcb2 transposase [Trichonephila clavipes]